jgi:hypothetical protein
MVPVPTFEKLWFRFLTFEKLWLWFLLFSGSGTVINYGSGSDFLTSYGSGSISQKFTVPTVPVCPTAGFVDPH